MKMNPLGRTGINVSSLSLGTMTFGTQTPQKDAHAQIDMSLAAGINLVDTAEMYPVNPLSAETQGLSEEIVGNWFENTGRRADVVLATKHSGKGLKYVRNGAAITSQSIPEAIEGSLKRLKTDYIDLYQFHWPNRGSFAFRQNWSYDPSKQDYADTIAHMHDALGALQIEVEKGRIRAFGLSNETAWGIAQWTKASEATGGPRAASIQNEYSLLCRLFDTDGAEASVNENVGLLAYSPLAVGLLSGKYQGGAIPEGSRMTVHDTLAKRKTPLTMTAVDTYMGIANKHGLDPVQMSLAWCEQRSFMTSVIFGATHLAQLENTLKTVDLTLSDEVLADIDKAHHAHPMPF